jgi:hypothetical protein
MNGGQQCVTYEDLAVIAIALQRRAPTLAYPILCRELDALIQTARALVNVDDALCSCLGSAMALRALRHPDRALDHLVTLLLRDGRPMPAANCERSLSKQYRPFDSTV